MAVQLAVGQQFGGVVLDHGQDREAQRLLGVCVGAIPDLAGGLRSGAGFHAHAFGLDALAGEGIGRAWGAQYSFGHHQQLASRLCGHLHDEVTLIDADPLD